MLRCKVIRAGVVKQLLYVLDAKRMSSQLSHTKMLTERGYYPHRTEGS